MTIVLQEHVGRFIHVYLNDIFVFSDTINEHEKHLRLVLDALAKAEFYLECDKCDLYAVRLNCLRHMIDSMVSTQILTKWQESVSGGPLTT